MFAKGQFAWLVQDWHTIMILDDLHQQTSEFFFLELCILYANKLIIVYYKNTVRNV